MSVTTGAAVVRVMDAEHVGPQLDSRIRADQPRPITALGDREQHAVAPVPRMVAFAVSRPSTTIIKLLVVSPSDVGANSTSIVHVPPGGRRTPLHPSLEIR